MATRGKWIRPLARSIGGEPPVDPEPLPDIQLRDPRWDYATHGMEQVLHGARAARKVGESSVYRIAGKSGTAGRGDPPGRVPSWPSAIATMPCLLPLPRCMTRRSRWR